jgi:hypothetical protein
MAESEIKLPEEEFREIVELRDRIKENVEILGRISIRKHFLEMDLSSLNTEMSLNLKESEDLNTREKEVTEKIVEKYGEGKLDFSTGVYIKS